MKLNQEQQDAVERLGQDVCVVAGPGSGKTRVLVERFRWRVEQGASPLRILAVTFTEKAANELKARLSRDFSGRRDLREQIERAPVHTIDAFCARVLREHAIAAEVDPQFDLFDPADAYAALWASAEEALDALFQEDGDGMRALLASLDVNDPIAALVAVYQNFRITATGFKQVSPEAGALARLREALERIVAGSPAGWSRSQEEAFVRVKEWASLALALPNTPVTVEHFRVLNNFDCNLTRLRRNNPLYDGIKAVKQNLLAAARQELVAEYYAPQRALLWHAIERLAQIYRERKEGQNALDFADLEEFAIRLLRDNETVRELVRNSFDEILMDELQDTNPLQAMLIEHVRKPGRFFAVGDLNQSIYGFRCADPDVFKRYRDEIRAQSKPIDKLHKNYRSRREILFAANAILGGSGGIEARDLEAARAFAQKQEPSVEVIAALADTIDAAAELEAGAVARRILELEGKLLIREKETGIDRAACLSDMVILVRNVNALEPFEQALHKLDVPYLVGRGKHFYEAQEVSDLVHLLRVVSNPRDEISMAVVLRSPLVGIRNETLFRLRQTENLGAALEILDRTDTSQFDAGDLERLRAFRERLWELRSKADGVSPDRLILRAMDAADYESTLAPRYRANVKKLLARLRESFHREPRPLSRFVEELEFLRASDPDEPAAPPDDSANAVRIITVHSAKGLEFPIVFLAALHKGVANGSPPVAFSPASGLVARWLDPISGEPVKDSLYETFSAEQKRRALEEENRLLYVAITRAEEHLVLSCAKTQKDARNWADKVLSGLGLEFGDETSGLSTHRVGGEQAFDVRVWAVRADGCGTGLTARPRSETAAEDESRCARPLRAAQHDASAAVTSIALFAECPRRYYLARYLGWHGEPSRPALSEVEDDAIDAGELGRQVHALLAEARVPDASPLALELAGRFQAGELARRAALAVEPRARVRFHDGGR